MLRFLFRTWAARLAARRTQVAHHPPEPEAKPAVLPDPQPGAGRIPLEPAIPLERLLAYMRAQDRHFKVEELVELAQNAGLAVEHLADVGRLLRERAASEVEVRVRECAGRWAAEFRARPRPQA
jgi:hypothetical protein